MTSISKFLYLKYWYLIKILTMKNFFLIILSILSSFLIFNSYTQAISLSDFTPWLDKKVSSLKTTEEQVKFLQSFADTLATSKFTKDKNARVYKQLREYTLNMLSVFQYELKKEQAAKTSKWSTTKTTSTKISTSTTTIKTTSTNKLPHLSDNFSNINEQKVRDAILSWHNYEREYLWLNNYKYNLDLEWSATVRANKLANSSKTTNLHLRNSWDWTYNYNSILNWFSDLWIKFPASVKWAVSFSESIWYWYYKCSKSDCTQDLINAVKKTRTWLIMKEKSSNGNHYRAAIMKHFTQMWAWIVIDKSHNRYYVVFHYWVNF